MQRLPHLRLIVAGDGPERGRLEQLAAELGLANRGVCRPRAGSRSWIAAIADSRFTVLPSHAYETLGKTILESYAKSAGRSGHGPGIAAGTGAGG